MNFRSASTLLSRSLSGIKIRSIGRIRRIQSSMTCNSSAARVATRAITLIKHRVHIGNNGRALNRVKRRSFPLVGIIQTSAQRSRLAAPVRRLSIFVTFRRWNPDARRRRGDLAPTATHLLDVISIICLRLWIIASNSRITFETFGGRRGQPRTYTPTRRRNRIQRELSSDHAKPEVVSDVRIRNILGGSCR